MHAPVAPGATRTILRSLEVVGRILLVETDKKSLKLGWRARQPVNVDAPSLKSQDTISSTDSTFRTYA